MKFSIIFTFALPLAASAFSSPSIPFTSSPSFLNDAAPVTRGNKNSEPSTTAAVTAAPWRVVLDIGREPLASMPFDWARSGCRLPLVIPCDFQSDSAVVPKTETVSFTGTGGAVVRPIEGGNWKLSKDKKQLSLSLTFPEYFERSDVYVDAGTPITLQTRVYTKDEVDTLNKEYYEARDEAWALGEELNNISRMINGPKQWNEKSQAWEKRTDGIPSFLVQGQKRMRHLAAETLQKQKGDLRPDPNSLSERGTLPGLDSDVFIVKQGTIRIGTGKKAVMGKWLAEPLNEHQAAYYATR